jgi:hypothetical protein
MLGRVARTLLRCADIARIVVLAQDPDLLMGGELDWMAAEPRIEGEVSGSGISTSIARVAGTAAAPWPVLVVTADHALLTEEMVDHFIANASGDAALAVVERATVDASYPETRRTWLKFRGGHYSGANLFALLGESSRPALDLWAEVEQNRKKALKLLGHFGPLLAFRALTRTITLDAALDLAGRKTRLTVKAVRLPFAEAAIDVDKQADLDLVRRIVKRRAQKNRRG